MAMEYYQSDTGPSPSLFIFHSRRQVRAKHRKFYKLIIPKSSSQIHLPTLKMGINKTLKNIFRSQKDTSTSDVSKENQDCIERIGEQRDTMEPKKQTLMSCVEPPDHQTKKVCRRTDSRLVVANRTSPEPLVSANFAGSSSFSMPVPPEAAWFSGTLNRASPNSPHHSSSSTSMDSWKSLESSKTSDEAQGTGVIEGRLSGSRWNVGSGTSAEDSGKAPTQEYRSRFAEDMSKRSTIVCESFGTDLLHQEDSLAGLPRSSLKVVEKSKAKIRLRCQLQRFLGFFS
ncbi:hypothetical protein NA57DRAFT_56012 [Rhizodiscina lignyota]|uniref:Uncharacterized protein n=1 Tax=Rhizodiscina lignyota TaxID=1504668 RepID=A0A9P4IIU4_9PEZI|nr:hypothetical protein NA57DRAFT_56012 [Rhizodiscina lignyota]